MDKLNSERRSWLMSRVKSKNTTTEMTVRRLIYGMGYRYRLHDKRLPGKPDLVFWGRRKAIFVNGCFWHMHRDCRLARMPKSRVAFWRQKLEANKRRDDENIELLKEMGWRVLVVWECQLQNKNLDEVSRRVRLFLDEGVGDTLDEIG